MPILKSGILYFTFVFGTGFVLGTIRVLWLVPQIGQRSAELAEMPLMLIASFFAARWVVINLLMPATVYRGLLVGTIALALLLVAELGVVFVTSSQSLADYLASRDPVAGSVYLFSLSIFALLPAIIIGLSHNRPARRTS